MVSLTRDGYLADLDDDSSSHLGMSSDAATSPGSPSAKVNWRYGGYPDIDADDTDYADDDDNASMTSQELEEEWNREMAKLKATLTLIVLPFIGRFLGRRLGQQYFPQLINSWWPIR
ncbi:hypothetical protein RI367_006326 [Sorochytrium milnesiophthora]